MTEAELAKLNAIFYPKRVAVIGATGSPDKVGFIPALYYTGRSGLGDFRPGPLWNAVWGCG